MSTPNNKSTALAPLKSMNWLVQPLSVTMMQTSYTNTQNCFLVLLVEYLQEAIKEQINNPSLFPNWGLFEDPSKFDETVVSSSQVLLKIPLKELIPDRRRMSEIRPVLEHLMSIPVYFRKVDKEGKMYDFFTPLCSFAIPTSYRENYIYVPMQKETAMLLLDPQFGFHGYFKEVVLNSKTSWTQRIYWLLSQWKKQGETPFISYNKLRQQLGTEPTKGPDGKMVGKTIHPRWDMFKIRVLDSSYVELYDKAQRGEVDLYFEMEFKYKGSKKRGEPDAIKFHVLQSAAGKEYQIERGNNAQRLKLEEFLRDTFQQTRTNVIGIMKRVTSENVAELSNFLTSLEVKIKQQGEKISSVKAWSHRSIMGWLDDWDQARTAQLEMQFAPNTATETQTSEKVAIAIYSDEDAAKWNDALALVKKAIAKDTFDVWFSALMLGKCSNNSITIWAPTALYIEMMAAKSDNILAESIAITFGPDTVINYVVGKEKRPK